MICVLLWLWAELRTPGPVERISCCTTNLANSIGGRSRGGQCTTKPFLGTCNQHNQHYLCLENYLGVKFQCVFGGPFCITSVGRWSFWCEFVMDSLLFYFCSINKNTICLVKVHVLIYQQEFSLHDLFFRWFKLPIFSIHPHGTTVHRSSVCPTNIRNQQPFMGNQAPSHAFLHQAACNEKKQVVHRGTERKQLQKNPHLVWHPSLKITQTGWSKGQSCWVCWPNPWTLNIFRITLLLIYIYMYVIVYIYISLICIYLYINTYDFVSCWWFQILSRKAYFWAMSSWRGTVVLIG